MGHVAPGKGINTGFHITSLESYLINIKIFLSIQTVKKKGCDLLFSH